MPARVISVNVGLPREVQWQGRMVLTSIWKDPVSGPVTIEGVNLVGDDQADRRVHGGPDKAVYAYAIEDYRWWEDRFGWDYPAATFGENLTTEGIDLRTAQVGDRWQVGTATLEVAQPRSPCYKLGIRMNDEHFPGRFLDAARPGAYLRIVTPGTVQAGDQIEVAPASTPAVSLRDLFGDQPDRDVLQRIATDARVPEGWRKTAQRALRES